MRVFTELNSALLISKVIHTDLETDLRENPYVITLHRDEGVVFALGVLISDQFFITAARPIHNYTETNFEGIYIKLAMLDNLDQPYYIEGAVFNSCDHISFPYRDINLAVLRVSDFMHEILEFK